MDSDAPVAWLFVQADAVPPAWQARSRPFAFVPLAAPEVAALLRDSGTPPEFDAGEARLLHLLARGRTASSIARELGISRSTVQRRAARLRDRLGSASLMDTALLLAQQGFAVSHEASPPAAGGASGA
ncbi:MAG: Bacterial regulatory protein luxR family [Frankiaceae bacterium]|jgi:DNA-binding NarL/FixJ family response regulator|nr:Bacterial regulatory protein luxR family [Frankiaceae bacterium]